MMGSYSHCHKCGNVLLMIRQGKFKRCWYCYNKKCKIKYKSKSSRRIKKALK